MYTSAANHSSKKSIHAHRINQTAFSFADQFRQHPTPYEVNKKLSQQVTSSPLKSNLNHLTRGSDQNTFNSGWTNQLSKIQQLNSKISRTTQEIIQSKYKSRVSDQHSHKQPEEKKKKYYRQYVRFQPSSLNRNNYGHEPIIIRRQSKDNDSQGKRSRKSSTKINFIYENSPLRKNSFQSGIEKVQKPERDSLNTHRSTIFQSPSSSKYYNIQLSGYRSTELILADNRELLRKSSLKKDVTFNIQSTKSNGEYNPNTRSAISSYEMAKYSPKAKQRGSEETYSRGTQKDSMIKMTGSSYLEENFGSKYSQGTDRLRQKQNQRKKTFYEMEDYQFEEKDKKWMEEDKGKQGGDEFYEMDQANKKKFQSFSFQQPTSREEKHVRQNKAGAEKTLSQMKDKESRMIAIALIVLALIIFVMQLLS